MDIALLGPLAPLSTLLQQLLLLVRNGVRVNCAASGESVLSDDYFSAQPFGVCVSSVFSN